MSAQPFIDYEQTDSQVHERALADLAHVLSHRLRGLVASIEGFTDLLADTLGSREQRDLALRIFEGAARIEHILADLHLYSRPIQPVTTPLGTDYLTGDLLSMLDEPDRSRIRVEERSEGPQNVLVDPLLIRQALLVLVQNALDATARQGTVLLRIVKNPWDDSVCFEVWNEGCIVIDRAAEQVFEPFFTTKAQNLGVGLSIARRIVEAHGGTLHLSSNHPDDGVCFSLCIPVVTDSMDGLFGS